MSMSAHACMHNFLTELKSRTVSDSTCPFMVVVASNINNYLITKRFYFGASLMKSDLARPQEVGGIWG